MAGSSREAVARRGDEVESGNEVSVEETSSLPIDRMRLNVELRRPLYVPNGKETALNSLSRTHKGPPQERSSSAFV